ncbi:hypothetical protein MHTCC0001_18190 [Flavobacteriaceae bacterium MHTCC 0001]
MHVSSKVAFRLDDVFYRALNKSECIALESDPTQWLRYMHEDFGQNYNINSFFYDNNFYKHLFSLSPLTPIQIRNVIRFDNYLINSYLYRKDFGTDDFEEETYLDMFIYQAGKKNNKPVIGLENFRQSRYLTTKASYNMNKRKPDEWFVKLRAKKNMFMFQEDVYRNRDIELLDSIGAATNTKFYREHMLFKRNENMVNVLDSIMHKKIIFSGVGAAHLGGEKGMLNMLRERGYTVEPLISKQTQFAKVEKETLDNLFTTPTLKLHATSDGFLSIKSFDELREFAADGIKYYVAPDMTNGAYLTINRLNRFPYLPSKKDKVDLNFIENLLYEDIPGVIISKAELLTPYPGISILNKTKKGDYQKYHIYKTPLEIIVIKFGGKKDFVLKYEAEIFASIKFKTGDDGTSKFKEPNGKYEFEMPENFITSNLEHPGKKLVQSVSNGNFYFFQESPQHDIAYIEEDAFEAKFIHTSFYKNLDITGYKGDFVDYDYKSYQSSVMLDTINNKKLWLRSVVKDGSYYLLGVYGDTKNKAEGYFNSLKFQSPSYSGFKIERDTSLLFTVNSPVKPRLSFERGYNNQRKKAYDQSFKETTYTTIANEQIFIERTKFHDLKMFENVDSLWSSVTLPLKFSKFLNEFSDKNLKVVDKQQYTESDINYFTHKLRDSLSAKEILVKYIQKKGVLYKLSTLTDTINKPSKFLTKFYNSFQPLDTLLGEDVFRNKTQLFFDALKNNDSIALTGYQEVLFSKKNTQEIIQVLKHHKFTKDKAEIKDHLLWQLIKNDNSETVNRYIKTLYTKSYSQPSIQNTILNALFKRRDKASYEHILELLNTDVPLGNRIPSFRTYDMSTDTLKTTKVLFPQLLDFSLIEEYKDPIYGLLTKLLDSNVIKPKLYKKFKKQIVNDAKIEIKRGLGNKNSYKYTAAHNTILSDYTKLLFPYRNDKQVKLFYLRLLESENWDALTTYYVLLKSKNELIPNQLKSKTLHHLSAQHLLISKLKQYDLLDKKETDIINLKAYAKSKLFATNSSYKKTEPKVTFLEEKVFKTDTGKPIRLFLFKKQENQNHNSNEFILSIAFEDIKGDTYNTKSFYTSPRRGIMISGYKTEDDIIEETILSIKHKTRKRINIARF